MKPVVIAVAITGSVPRKKDNPAVPTTPAEQVESTHAAFEAGATLVHIHVRNPDESPLQRPRAVRPGAGRRAEALPRHDRAVLHIPVVATVFAAAYAVQPAYGIGFAPDVYLWIPVAGNIVAVLVIPYVGNLSDHIGRRIPVMVGAIAFGVTAIAAAAAFSARETYRVHIHDLGRREAVPVAKPEYERLRAETLAAGLG